MTGLGPQQRVGSRAYRPLPPARGSGTFPSLAPAPSPPSLPLSLPASARSLRGALGRWGPATALTRCWPREG